MGIYFTANKTPNTFGFQSINEVYFGESKELNEILSQIGVIRSKYEYKSKYFSKINTDPELIRLNRMFEDFFGFETFCLVLEEKTEYNAYTFPASHAIGAKTGRDAIETTKQGFRFKKNCGLNLFMVVHSSLFMSQAFSDREILGIMLHEIGHSFSASLHPTCTLGSYVGKMNNVMILIMSPILIISNTQAVMSTSNALRGWANRVSEKIKREHTELNDMFHAIKGAEGFITGAFQNVMAGLSVFGTIMNPIGSFINTVYNKFKNVITHPDQILNNILGYKDEQIADNFATLYGYGNDLSSALIKMKQEGFGLVVYKESKKSPLIGHMYDLFSLPIDMVTSLMDPHPLTSGRVQSQLKYLKEEMKKQNMDPKMKKQIMKDIKDIEGTINETYKKASTSDPDFFSRAYSAILLNICNGDIRNIFDKPDNARFDKIASDTKI